MPVTVWKGHLTFGLVSIPVRLFRAAHAQRVILRQLYRPTRPEERESAPTDALAAAASIPQRGPSTEGKRDTEPEQLRGGPTALVTPVKRVYLPADAGEHAQPIRKSDLVKGYEYANEYVVLDDRDLRDIASKTSTEMQIMEFVRFGDIDPVYLETSYYAAPDEGGEKAYALLLKALQETGFAAIGQLTMRRRDHILIVRPGKSGLIAHTMFYTDEVRTVDEFRTKMDLVSPKELDLAKALIQALATSFEPEKFKNQFRERLHQLIESRAAFRQVTPIAAPTPIKVSDMMDALKRSLAEVKSAEPVVQPETARTQRRPPTGERSTKKSEVSHTRKRR